MKFLLPILLFSLIFGCQQFDGKTKSNYPYKFHVDKKGVSPKVGDKVSFDEEVWLNDEIIFSTKEYGRKEIILPSEEIITRPLPPNYEILFKMSEGDSVTITQELKDLKNLPEGYTTDDVLKYVVKLVYITPKEKVLPSKKKGKTSATYPYEIFLQNGNVLALPGDRVRFREYRFINDSLVFSSPIDQPSQAFLPSRNQVPNPPPGNYEALLLAGMGDSLHLSQLLTGMKNLPKSLSKNDTINYKIKILDVLTPGEYVIYKKINEAESLAKKDAVKARKEEVVKSTQTFIEKYKKGKLDDELTYTRSGLKFFIHKMGEGKLPNMTEDVSVQFAGFLMNGNLFDSTFDTGNPLTFPLGMGRVIKGWEEGISKLPEGSVATFIIPYKLAYGIFGKPPNIPNRANLVFHIEVEEVE